MRECLQDGRLQWLGHLEGTKESAWYSKCRAFRVRNASMENIKMGMMIMIQ